MPWTHPHFWIFPGIITAILGLFAAFVSYRRIRPIYERHFPTSRKERSFLASVGFFTAVLVVRGITWAIHNDIGPFHDVSMKGRHIHHLVWGILLLLTVGYGWLLEVGSGDPVNWTDRIMSMAYGVAAALTLDEFALWLNLRDVYWEREGRESFEALALFGAMLAVAVLGGSFFRGLAKEAASKI